MVASMLLPTFAVIALSWAHVVAGMGVPMVIEHLAMLGSMLIAMLLRLEEYTGAAQAHGVLRHAIAE
jgi:hypothetical protein